MYHLSLFGTELARHELLDVAAHREMLRARERQHDLAPALWRKLVQDVLLALPHHHLAEERVAAHSGTAGWSGEHATPLSTRNASPYPSTLRTLGG